MLVTSTSVSLSPAGIVGELRDIFISFIVNEGTWRRGAAAATVFRLH
jgi:hypothetical protein